jgi:glycosyltransferase involved in cell wall biosynthesis
VPAFAEAVGRLVKDPEVRWTMGQQARRFAEMFTWEASAKAMEEVLERRLASATSGT